MGAAGTFSVVLLVGSWNGLSLSWGFGRGPQWGVNGAEDSAQSSCWLSRQREMYGLSSDVHPWVPEESRLCMQVIFIFVFMICGLAIVPKISWFPYLQARVNSHEGLSQDWNGWTFAKAVAWKRICKTWLSCPCQNALGPHGCRGDGVGVLIGW